MELIVLRYLVANNATGVQTANPEYNFFVTVVTALLKHAAPAVSAPLYAHLVDLDAVLTALPDAALQMEDAGGLSVAVI